MSERLLPSESGPATKAIAYTFDILRLYSGLIPTIKNYGLTVIPDDWVPWLVWDQGLEDVVPYVQNLRQVLAEAPGWQARRGTPRGIEIGIGWTGGVGNVEPGDGRHDWWEFQVRFPEPVADTMQLRQLDGIIRLSKASEDVLFRMFSPGYDHRPVRMDQHRADTGGWYDGYSGRQRWDGGPLISFGRSETGLIDVGPEPSGATFLETSSFLVWFEGPRYDIDRAGVRPGQSLTAGEAFDGGTEISVFDGGWPETWPDKWPAGGSIGPLAFVGLAAVDDDTILFTMDRDSWPDVWPGGSWGGAGGATPIPAPSEPS